MRRSSRSIYEHILAHIEPGKAGLQPCGEALPDDEDATTTGEPCRPAPDNIDERVDELHRALREVADRQDRRARNAVTELFQAGAQITLVRGLGARLRDDPPSDPNALYTELRTILFATRSREELKFAVVLVGTFERTEDAEVFRVLARHEEFTLFAAAALGYGADDWVGECLALLPDVSSGGATELSRLLLHFRDERVYSFLLRRSVAIAHALDLGVGWLCEALDSGDVDDDLRRATRSILDGLTWSFYEPEALLDHSDAAIAAEEFLELLTDRASTLDALIVAYELGVFLESAHPRVKRARKLSRAIVTRPEWHTMTTAALASDDRDERALAIEAAKRLGIPLRDHLVRSIKTDFDDSWLWYHLVPGADGEPIPD
ncbi:MAG TPA: hypothetical protein VLK36_17495 [Gaiellaceae bacterium]|nr:hypothetical protein [Gaiellaceae bacterium]